MNLSRHFTLEEMIASESAERSGIDNTPNEEVVANLRVLCEGLERVRVLLGWPIRVNSGYRCPALNAAIGGSTNSQHMTGNAADFICPKFGSPLEICRVIIASQIDFDQLIYEYSWAHISFVKDQPRGVVLTFKGRGYVEGIQP